MRKLYFCFFVMSALKTVKCLRQKHQNSVFCHGLCFFPLKKCCRNFIILHYGHTIVEFSCCHYIVLWKIEISLSSSPRRFNISQPLRLGFHSCTVEKMGRSAVSANPASGGKQLRGRDWLEDLNSSFCRGLLTEISGQGDFPDAELQTCN